MDFIRIDETGNREGFKLPELKKIKDDGKETDKNWVLPLLVDNFYITSDGYEYIRMGAFDLWGFIQSCIALEKLDTEPGFYGLSIYVAKENNVGGIDLQAFSYMGVKSTVADLCELASNGSYNEDNFRNIVMELKITA